MILGQVVGHCRILSSLCVFHIEKDWFKKVSSHLPREGGNNLSRFLIHSLTLTGPNHVSWIIWLSEESSVPVRGINMCEGLGATRALAYLITATKDFLGGPVVKNLPANAADMGSIPGLGRFYLLQGNWARASQLGSLHLEPACHNC